MTTTTWLLPAAHMPTSITLVDLIVVLLVAGAFVSTLRHRRSVLAAVGSSLAMALLCWVAAAAVLVWAPGPAQDAVAVSNLAAHVPLPVNALEQAGHLTRDLADSMVSRP